MTESQQISTRIGERIRKIRQDRGLGMNIAAEISKAQVGKTVRAVVDQPLIARGETDAEMRALLLAEADDEADGQRGGGNLDHAADFHFTIIGNAFRIQALPGRCDKLQGLVELRHAGQHRDQQFDGHFLRGLFGAGAAGLGEQLGGRRVRLRLQVGALEWFRPTQALDVLGVGDVGAVRERGALGSRLQLQESSSSPAPPVASPHDCVASSQVVPLGAGACAQASASSSHASSVQELASAHRRGAPPPRTDPRSRARAG